MKIKLGVPKHWVANLERLRTSGHKVAIAGGALRDLVCGKTPKDIDYWVFDAGISYHLVLKSLSEGDDKWSCDFEWDTKGYGHISPIYWISFVAQQRGHKTPIQVIGLEGVSSIIQLIERFDFGLNQIGFYEGKLIYTKAFEKDLKNHTFTLTHPTTYDRSKERFQTWVEEKYKGWTYEASGAVKRHEFIESFKPK